MPEGDVVWRICDRLDQALAGRTLTATDFRWASLATEELSGRKVLNVVARGKHILMRLSAKEPSPALTLHSPLTMEGSWHLMKTDEATPRRLTQHDIRAVISTDAWTAVGYRLGELDLYPTSDEENLLGYLGPDILGPDWNLSAAVDNVRHADCTIVEALLDQSNIAGIGTFYACEALFVRGISPHTPPSAIPDIEELLLTAQRMIRTNTTHAIQSTTGDTRPGKTSYVHTRHGKPCRRCGTLIIKEAVGDDPQLRVMSWCPTCQRLATQD